MELEGLGSQETMFKTGRPGSWEDELSEDAASLVQILHLIIKVGRSEIQSQE